MSDDSMNDERLGSLSAKEVSAESVSSVPRLVVAEEKMSRVRVLGLGTAFVTLLAAIIGGGFALLGSVAVALTTYKAAIDQSLVSAEVSCAKESKEKLAESYNALLDSVNNFYEANEDLRKSTLDRSHRVDVLLVNKYRQTRRDLISKIDDVETRGSEQGLQVARQLKAIVLPSGDHADQPMLVDQDALDRASGKMRSIARREFWGASNNPCSN
ncbi:hypothetical protein ACFXPA_30865 [Amycolatopsis sp. NPDC059090]|uniref:hypothetical protein n=1 Tax=unclassified Amycolatopsis TaxID=2618356 RepID=UPI003672D4CB